MKTNNQTLQLCKEGYIGLQFAQQTTEKVLKDLINGMPIRFRMLSFENKSVYEFSGNGISVTVHVVKERRLR